MTGSRRALLPTVLLLTAGVLLGGEGRAAEAPHGTTPEARQETPAPQRAVVRWREILTEGGATRIRLEASPRPQYRIFTSTTPPVVEVDLYDVNLEGLPPKVDVGDGTIETVEARALPGGVGRLTVRLAGPGEGEVVPWEQGLDVLVRLTGGGNQPLAGAQRETRVVSLLEGNRGLAFRFGSTPTNLSAFLLSDGKRLVVDAEGVTLDQPQFLEELSGGPVTGVRLARQEGRVRAVVEAKTAGAFTDHSLEKTPDGFNLVLAGASLAAAQPAAGEKPGPVAEKKPEASVPMPATPAEEKKPEPEPKGGGEVVDLGFRQENGRSLVEVVLSKSAPQEVRETTETRIVIDILKTRLPDKFRRALDTSAFSGPVKLVAAYARKHAGGVDTRLVIDLKRPAPFRTERRGARITVSVEGSPEAAGPPPGVAEVQRADQEVVVVEGKAKPAPTAAEDGAHAEAQVPAVAPRPGYTGRRLSMDFVDADIRNVLRLIGEVSGLNMVAGDDVQGKVTVRLVDVPWDQALEVILKTRGLDRVRDGNVIRIAPAEKLAAEQARIREAQKGVEEEAPLVSDILPVNYASAKELLDKIKSILTKRGSATVDDRTNSILVKDVAEKIQEARTLVARLDTQTPQVLIEARIVEVASTYTKDLGIQWGGKYTADTAHGNATGWAFPNSISAVGSTGAGNYAVNFPAAVSGGGPGGALSLTLGHINDILTLDLRLSALETSGRGRVIASPRVATLDNRTAEISQGTSIPFTTATQEKIETQSIDYLLKLNVTPHVTADRSIIMKIDLKKDSPSRTFVAVDSQTPAKETRAATTEVLVRDGETTVIGGIITDETGNSDSGIPFLSKIPGLGWLFKRKQDNVTKTELVIFITPKIANLASVAGNP